jgi:hypothetical protein
MKKCEYPDDKLANDQKSGCITRRFQPSMPSRLNEVRHGTLLAIKPRNWSANGISGVPGATLRKGDVRVNRVM